MFAPLTALLLHSLIIAQQPFTIKVVDEQTGRGVPLVELRTVHDVRYWTDSGGVVAFDEPGLLGERVFFHVSSHGYEFPRDGFGYRGQALDTVPGGSATLRIKRRNIAERLYRVTGAGIYRDTVLSGGKPPLAEPLLNARVLGSDSVVTAVYRDKLYWFWGDTNRVAYPLANFQVSGATSPLVGLRPDEGIPLTYFVDDKGFAKPMAPMPGAGPTWIFGLVAFQDEQVRERMFATYQKVKPPLTIYERGLVEFDDERQEFAKVCAFPAEMPARPDGQALLVTDAAGQRWVYFAHPYPLVRVPATPAALADPGAYEAFTCLPAHDGAVQEDRTASGEWRFAWRKHSAPFSREAQARLVQNKSMRPDDGWFNLRSSATGEPVVAHSGSVCWCETRQRYVMIFVEQATRGAPSLLGEVWYAEAERPEGPWKRATKVLTHDDYTFYNPKIHDAFGTDQGRLYFEGTYTHTFSGNKHPTPRYEYNQVMYRLDVNDPRLPGGGGVTGER